MRYIGIDPGTHTGLAVWKDGRLETCVTTTITKAMDIVRKEASEGEVFVRCEDARKRKWIPAEKGRAVLQGVGSVKRDCSIWETFLTELGVEFEMLPPQKGMTKIDANYFKALSGFDGKTSEHARDAAMLVIGFKR